VYWREKEIVARTFEKVAARNRGYVAAAALSVLTISAFAGACGNQFLHYDDEDYVTHNQTVSRGLNLQGLAWDLTARHAANWHPLTWLSLQLDAQVYGLEPWGFHLTNLLLHAANAALLFLLLRNLTAATAASLLAATFFALHPLRVESVAWVAERKDTLSGFFAFLTLFCYTRYAHRPKLGSYLNVIMCYGLSLACKPILVTLPAVLLLLDWWPLARWQHQRPRNLLIEKLPLLAMAGAVAVVTLTAQGTELVGLHELPIGARIKNALVAYVDYVIKLGWPLNLAPLYPRAPTGPSIMATVAAGAVLLAFSTFCFASARRRPYLLIGWIWYVVMLVPVIGFVQVGLQATADRYTYLSGIGLLIVVVWGTLEGAGRRRWGQWLLLPGVIGVAISLHVITQRQVKHWYSDQTIWEHTSRINPDNAVAHNNLGCALWLRSGMLGKDPALLVPAGSATASDLEGARQEFAAAARLDMHYAQAYTNLGDILNQQGKPEEARIAYGAAVDADPNYALGHYRLGRALAARGDDSAACAEFSAALRADQTLAPAHEGWAEVLRRHANSQGALMHMAAAVKLDPHSGPTLEHFGETLVDAGRRQDAIEVFRSAAVAYAADNQTPGAARVLRRALLIVPESDGALAKTLRQELGRYDSP
jgi:Flp pilus assembly protein TadD